ncbi:hypothetical protein LTR70_008759 [Exophiala xenobiotica]|nr:hypothetical protein LTR70_008759 [Exophiala xenobiotica]
MDIDDGSSDSSSVDSLVLGLAAHPLSSPNPPPQDLPDLLDGVIASEAELRRKWVVCDQLANKLVKRVVNVKQRLETLRQAYPQYRTNMAHSKRGPKTKDRMCFQAGEELYQRMFMQTSFMHNCLTRNLKVLLQRQMKAHKDIFGTLLGGRHDHRGIEVANSRALQCAPGCNWYAEHGPYEWTKQPYTDQWWEEMNDTNWDWVRMRQHMSDTIANARGKAILVADMFFSNARTHVPVWFWYEKYETWSPFIDVRRVQNENGSVEERVVCKIRFEKTEAIMEKERSYKREQTRRERSTQDDAAEEGIRDDSVVEISAVGEREIDPAVVFDGDAYSPDFNNGGQPMSIGSWLDCLGYQKWLNSYSGAADQHPNAAGGSQGVAASSPTAG